MRQLQNYRGWTQFTPETGALVNIMELYKKRLDRVHPRNWGPPVLQKFDGGARPTTATTKPHPSHARLKSGRKQN
jgi:hypothetical protein